MGYLVLSILMNVLIFTAFRSFTKFQVALLPAVVINYVVCSFIGLAVFHETVIPDSFEAWNLFAVTLGIIFISTFYLLGLTTQYFGITIATVSSKMSLIIPVIFGLFIFETAAHEFDGWNYAGVLLALVAVALTSLKPAGPVEQIPQPRSYWIFPLALFCLAGILDTTLNYVNFSYLDQTTEVSFIVGIFVTAALIGVVILILRGQPVSNKSLWGGILLGIPNFFSMFFILKALTAFNHDGAVLFPLFNMGIILGSAGVAVTIFRERLLTINKLGIILAVLSVIMLSYQELRLWIL